MDPVSSGPPPLQCPPKIFEKSLLQLCLVRVISNVNITSMSLLFTFEYFIIKGQFLTRFGHCYLPGFFKRDIVFSIFLSEALKRKG